MCLNLIYFSFLLNRVKNKLLVKSLHFPNQPLLTKVDSTFKNLDMIILTYLIEIWILMLPTFITYSSSERSTIINCILLSGLSYSYYIKNFLKKAVSKWITDKWHRFNKRDILLKPMYSVFNPLDHGNASSRWSRDNRSRANLLLAMFDRVKETKSQKIIGLFLNLYQN